MPDGGEDSGRLQDGSEWPEEKLRAHGLWRWPRGGAPSEARPDDPTWERARREGIGLGEAGPARPDEGS